MPALKLEPVERELATVAYALTGNQHLDFKVRMEADCHMTLVDLGRPFPRAGLIYVRRGYDFNSEGQKIVDAVHYEVAGPDDDDGNTPESFRVNLAMEENGFDALLDRLQAYGLPTVHLYFEVNRREVLTYRDGSPSEDLVFHTKVRHWEQIDSATLIQAPFQLFV